VHEWALAEATVAKAAEVARERGITRVREVVIGLGELQDVARDAFEQGLTITQQNVPELASAEFTFEVDPAQCGCLGCGHGWPLSEWLAALPEDERESVHLVPEMLPLYVSCPKCGSPDIKTVGGRGVSLVAVNA